MTEKPILYLAPLHGVTNSVVRNALYKHFGGIDVTMAPFVNSIHPETTYAKSKENHFKDLIAGRFESVPLIPQIMGNEPLSFIETAKTIAGFGYTEVNWNLGCPFPMVTNKKRGSGLLPHPALIERFLEVVCAGVTIDISIKLRLGLTDKSDILKVIPILNGFPLKKIIIHPRVGSQMYGGQVDLDAFAEATALSRHQVMYNGDIKNAETFVTLQKRFPSVTEWMIGRWGMYNPFLFSQIKSKALPERPSETIRLFHDDLYSKYREILFGPKHVLDKMKEIWTYLGKSFSLADKLLAEIRRAKTLDVYEKTVNELFLDTVWHGKPV